MNVENDRDPTSTHRQLWFSLWGGGAAWLIHLLLAYAIAEFGCATDFRYVTFLNVTAVAWLLIVVSLGTIVLAGSAAYVGFRNRQMLQAEGQNPRRQSGTELYAAKTALLLNILFIVVILVQTLPILFFLDRC